jgi:hypothetical protein
MVQGAKERPRIGKRIKDSKEDEKKLYSLIRRSDTPTNIQVPFFSGAGASENQGGGSSTNFLPTAGGTMIGPIAFFPKLVPISAGAIDIDADTDNFSSRIIVSSEAGFTDDLTDINGAVHAGQFLILQGTATHTITIKTTGNIETLDGNDFSLEDDDNILLVFDSTDNKWQQITNGKQGGTGGGGGGTSGTTVSFKTGTFTKSTNTSTPVDQSVTGVGFVPKAVILYSHGQTGTQDSLVYVIRS